MKISIACNDFPISMVDDMSRTLKEHGVDIQAQESSTGTLFITANTDDVVKAQVLCVLVDKYRFARNLKGGESDEETF